MRLLASLLLIGFLATGEVQHTLAHLGIIWRLAVLSWDNPATQWQDEIASQSSTCQDASGEASDAIRRTPPRKLALHVRSDTSRLAADISSTVSRAPPSR
jgi:hypothetical protein